MSDNNSHFDVNKLIANLLTRCLASAYNSASVKVKKLIDKVKVECNFAFTEYLLKSYEKYSKIKTLIYKNEPKYLYDFFECNSLKFKDKIIDPSTTANLFKLSHLILIRGSAGVGKSTLMRHFFINTLRTEELIPVFIELRDLNSYNGSLFQYILDSINKFSKDLNTTQFEHALSAGFFAFILDGFDELNQEKYILTLKELELLYDKYGKNYYIVSSRPNESLESFHQFIILDTIPFSQKQAISMINKIDYDQDIKKRFLIALSGDLYKRHISFASNPLLLTIMLLTFDSCAEIPNKRHIFYSNAFETLYFRHDATKSGFKREMASNLPFDQFRDIFAEFCFTTYLQGILQFTYTDLIEILGEITTQNEFSKERYIEDLTNSVCVIHIDAGVYTFTHRSFQEYFTALHIKSLSDKLYTKTCLILLDNGWNIGELIEMIYDMSQNRFEKNIILPIAKKAEEQIDTSKDRYHAFFEYLIPKIIFDKRIGISGVKIGNGKTCSRLLLLSRIYDHLNETSANHAVPKNDFAAAKKIGMLCEKKFKTKQVTPNEIFQDIDLSKLLRITWAGKLVFTASKLYITIYEKNIKNENSIKILLKGASNKITSF